MKYIERDFPIERINEIAMKEGNAKKPIYQIHKWWARRLGSVFRMLILATFTDYNEELSPEENEKKLWEHFYTKNQLINNEGKAPIVLDPFMGGGTTVVEALRLGCKVIGIDLNPVAWFTTKKEVDSVDFDALDVVFEQLKKNIASEIKQYYRTTCPRNHPADVIYIFWVKKVPCLACGKEVKIFPSPIIATKNGYHTVVCPYCHHIVNGDLHISDVGFLKKIDRDANFKCPECGKTFVPGKWLSGAGKYTCSHCGQKENILDAIRRIDGPAPLEMVAIEYYCETCGRGYKCADDWDINIFEEAKKEFVSHKDELKYPRQPIIDGLKTRDLLKHGYRYFYQLFNERQLLCLSTLLEEILKINDHNLREFFILTFSDSINANNMLCKYNSHRYELEPLFGLHAYQLIDMPVENNVWGTKIGRGTFTKYYQKTSRGKKYWADPDSIGDPPISNLVLGFEGLLSDNGNTILKAQTAEDLTFLPSDSVDAVITDPPYCDNVMYSELSDFFYIWLREALQDVEEFRPEQAPRAREIVKNNVLGKDDCFFFEGLTRVFRESERVLKKDGIFLFTFHHKEPWAWKSVLKSIVDAGFYVSAVYPIRSEGRTGVHGEAGNIRYDIPFVCRKRLDSATPTSWEGLKDTIYLRAQESVERTRKSGRAISDVDLFVMVMGRCLEVYSKYWPNVMKGDQIVGVDEAVDDIVAIVDSLIKSFELRQLPGAIDELTRLYLLYVAGNKDLTYDDLNKRLQTGGGSLASLIQHGYVTVKGKSLIVTNPSDRLHLIEVDAERGADIPIIDIAHYLYALYEQGRSIQRYVSRYARADIISVLELLYKKTGERTYSRIADQLRSQLGQRKTEKPSTSLLDFITKEDEKE